MKWLQLWTSFSNKVFKFIKSTKSNSNITNTCKCTIFNFLAFFIDSAKVTLPKIIRPTKIGWASDGALMIKLILQNNALSDLLILVAGIVQFFRNGTKTSVTIWNLYGIANIDSRKWSFCIAAKSCLVTMPLILEPNIFWSFMCNSNIHLNQPNNI